MVNKDLHYGQVLIYRPVTSIYLMIEVFETHVPVIIYIIAKVMIFIKFPNLNSPSYIKVQNITNVLPSKCLQCKFAESGNNLGKAVNILWSCVPWPLITPPQSISIYSYLCRYRIWSDLIDYSPSSSIHHRYHPSHQMTKRPAKQQQLPAAASIHYACTSAWYADRWMMSVHIHQRRNQRMMEGGEGEREREEWEDTATLLLVLQKIM